VRTGNVNGLVSVGQVCGGVSSKHWLPSKKSQP